MDLARLLESLDLVPLFAYIRGLGGLNTGTLVPVNAFVPVKSCPDFCLSSSRCEASQFSSSL